MAYSTGRGNLISSPTFHRSRRAAYREYLWIKSALSRLISGLRFRQNRQVGQVCPTSRLAAGPDFFGTHLRSTKKWEKSAIRSLNSRHRILSLSLPFLIVSRNNKINNRKYTCKNICSIYICIYNLYFSFSSKSKIKVRFIK